MRSQYTALWMMLAISFGIIWFISSADDINIAGHTLKKAPLNDFFSESAECSDSGNQIDSINFDSKNQDFSEVKVVETDSTKKSILLFGDSMTLNLALRLADYTAHNGHVMHAVNWDSSNTKIWAESDTLECFLKKYEVNYVFISLGSNELYFKKPETRLPYIKKLVATLGEIPFVWIGPPNWQEDSGINDLLEEVCGKGRFFRSAGMSFRRKADKIHPTRSSSVEWMDSIIRWLPKSNHPIVLELPPDSLKKSKSNVIFLKALNK